MSRIGPRKFTCITVSTVPASSSRRVAALRDPGVVHEDVDATERRERVGGEAVDGGRIAEVGDQFVHGCTVCPARRGRRREPIGSRPLIASTAPAGRIPSASPIPMPDDAPVTSTRLPL